MSSNTIDNGQSGETAATPPRRILGLLPLTWWRAATISCAILLAFALATGMSMFEQFKAQIAHLQKQLVTVPQIKYISVLTDDQGQASLLVTMDITEGQLVLQRLSSLAEGREQSLQLWAINAAGRARSLGLLQSSGKTLRIPGTERDLLDAPQLGVSVEPKGGVEDEHGPSGAMLLKGALVQKAL
ncbi:MAG: anti-sigma factor [Betaproteobacteria bacterium]